MRVASIDTETYLIRPGLLTPKLVCVSWAHRDGLGTDVMSGLLNRDDGLAFFRRCLADPDVTITGQNFCYDAGVFCAEDPSLIPLVFDAYEQGRIRDTRIRQKLHDISTGQHKLYWDGEKKVKNKFSLDVLVWRHFHRVLPKQDTWRLRYCELDGVPIADYPAAASEYAIRDAVETLAVFYAQEALITPEPGETSPLTMPDEIPQTVASWALHLMSAWGLRTDAEAAYALRDYYVKEVASAAERLREWGFIRADGKKSGTKDMEVIRARVTAACAKRGVAPPLTDSGQVATDADNLGELDDEQLDVLVGYAADAKNLTTYVPVVLAGITTPINPGFNPLVESGRTSCADPNIQNPPRKGGVREAFVSRPGFLYASCDYDTGELRTLAQVCLAILGESTMAEMLRQDMDLHSNLGATLLGISYAEFMQRLVAGDKIATETRQFSKVGMFGYPGGLGPDTFVVYARGFGLKVDRAFAKRIREGWLQTYPEMRLYLRYIAALTGNGEATVTQLYSGRVRGGVTYTQAANGYFQGLLADVAKDALWRVSRECYVDRTSPLYGSRPVNFLHDEIIAEVPNPRGHPEVASNAAKRLQTIMVETERKWLPDIPPKAGVVLMTRWRKGCKDVYDAHGNLLPARPVQDEKGNTRWVADVEREERAA